MVDLPGYPEGIVTSRAPQANVSPGQIAQPYSEFANTLKESGEAAGEAANSLATQAGLRAVSTDADGNIQIDKAPIVGPASQYYAKAVQMAALTDGEGAARRKDIELRSQFRDDPQGYLAAATTYTDGLQKKYTDQGGPALGLALRRAIEPITTYTYRGLLNEKERLDLQRADQTMSAGIASARDDLVALARGGDTSSPAFQAAYDKVRALTNERVSNPRLAYPQDKANYDLQLLDGDIKANAFLHHIDDVYNGAPNKADGARLAIQAAETLRTDPNLKLTEAQREAYYHRAVGEVHANEALRRQDVYEARLAWQQLEQGSLLGAAIAPADVDRVASAFEAAGDHASAARVYATMARKPLNDTFGQQPLAAQTDQLNSTRAQAAAKQAYDFFIGRGYTPAQASGIVGNLIHESSLNPAQLHDRDMSGQPTGIGIAGFRRERAAALAEFARGRGKDITDFQTQLEFIDQELHGSEGATLNLLKAATTPDEAATAFVNYERPRGYTPQNPAGSDQMAHRVALSRQVFTGQGNVALGTPASALWLQANRGAALDKGARAAWKTIQEDYTREGIRPSDKQVNDVLNAARAVGDHDLLETIGAMGDRIAAVDEAARRGLPMQAAQITEMTRLGAAGELTPGQNGVLKDLQHRYESITKGLKENPVATAVTNFPDRFKTPLPLNLQDQGQFAAGLAQRARIAQFASQNWQVGPVSALDKADMAQVSAAIEAADPDGKARIFQAIDAALPDDIRRTTLSKLGEKGPGQMVSALAGSLTRTAPDVAASILRGQQAMKADKAYLPQQKEEATFNEDMTRFLPPSTFGIAGRTDPAGPMAIASAAIKARYADLSAQAGDTSGTYHPDRLAQAVTDVTGGVLSHNGGSLIAPSRGMTQSQFDGVMWGLTDADLGNAPRQSNLAAADAALHLTPQERALYERHLSNLYGSGGVTNANGSRSSLYQTSFEEDGKTYNVPTVYGGKILSENEAIARARAEGLDKFPSYNSEAEAEARYQKMHEFMDRDTAQYFRGSTSAVTTLAGTPISASYLRDNAQLESIGEGRYLVRLGRDANRPIYAYQGANTELPQKFVLDLRNRTAARPPNQPTTPDFVP